MKFNERVQYRKRGTSMKKWKMGWILICGLVLLSACTDGRQRYWTTSGPLWRIACASALEFEGGEVVNERIARHGSGSGKKRPR